MVVIQSGVGGRLTGISRTTPPTGRCGDLAFRSGVGSFSFPLAGTLTAFTKIMIHELKTDPIPFQEIRLGNKTFEIRKNDRQYGRWDFLHLRETMFSGTDMAKGEPLRYTGRELFVTVTYIMEGYGLEKGFCGMAIKILK
jgi:hypothetical protein